MDGGTGVAAGAGRDPAWAATRSIWIQIPLPVPRCCPKVVQATAATRSVDEGATTATKEEEIVSILQVVNKNAITAKWVGIVIVIAGFLSLIAPLAGGLSITVIIGTLILLAGVMQLLLVFRAGSFGQGLLLALLGLIGVVAGGYTLMGSPTIVADIRSTGPNSQLAARLLDEFRIHCFGSAEGRVLLVVPVAVQLRALRAGRILDLLGLAHLWSWSTILQRSLGGSGVDRRLAWAIGCTTNENGPREEGRWFGCGGRI